MRYDFDFESHRNRYTPGEIYYHCVDRSGIVPDIIVKIKFVKWAEESLNDKHPETNMPYIGIYLKTITGEFQHKEGSEIRFGSKGLEETEDIVLLNNKETINFVFNKLK